MNRITKTILTVIVAFLWANNVMGLINHKESFIKFSFLGKEYSIKTIEVPGGFPESHGSQSSFEDIRSALDRNCSGMIPEMTAIQKSLDLSDWHYYQLIRKVSQQLIQKEKDYWGYTYCKWFFLAKIGFNPMLCTIDDKLLLYVQSSSTIYNIPIKMMKGNQYVCMNYHDYNYDIPIEKITPKPIQPSLVEDGEEFNYTISTMPDFPEEKYVNKTIEFTYKGEKAKHEIKICPEIKDYFINYPVTDFRFQFNIPLSKLTYSSLIPSLQVKLNKKTKEEGVEYIMFLVRNAFGYVSDSSIYGREKRYSPEETLASEWSDCEDHSGLFFTLVREVYNLPMIVISYPGHINVAVKLEKPKRKTINHNGSIYTICEPTPQNKVFYLGQMDVKLSKQPYEIVYEYVPTKS